MAARKINLALGFIPMPFRLEKAVEDEKKNDAHAICVGTPEEPHPPARVRNKVTCEVCGHVESSVYGYPKRGVEQDGKLVVLDADALKEAQGAPIKTLQLEFRNRAKVYGATVTAGSVNYLIPDKGGEKAYAYLVEVLTRNPDWVGIGIWAPVSANTLWVIELVEQRLVMTSRCWPENVRLAPAMAPVETVKAEADMFEQAAEAYYSDDFDVAAYVDQKKAGRAALVASLAGEAVEITPAAAPAAAQVDIMAAMRATLEAAKPKTPVRRTTKAAAKKTPAKKTAAAKKAPAKKKAAPAA